MSEKTILSKCKNHAFGKDIYLLGQFEDGNYFWLEEASWDCDWYWGFGYIETYTNNENPSRSRDIQSHQHYDGLVFKHYESYDFAKRCFVKGSHYMNILNDNPNVGIVTLTPEEQWELSDLMKSYYTLRSAAEVFLNGNSHYTSNVELSLKDEELAKHINQVVLPKIFKRVYSILTPEESKKE